MRVRVPKSAIHAMDLVVAMMFVPLGGVASVLVGIVHGLAGSAALMLLALALRWLGSRSKVVPIWIARASGALSIAAGPVVAFGALSPRPRALGSRDKQLPPQRT